MTFVTRIVGMVFLLFVLVTSVCFKRKENKLYLSVAAITVGVILCLT